MIRIESIETAKRMLFDVKVKVLGEEKVLVFSDLHIPFHREDMILDIINKHKNEITTIIFGGDVVDCEGISKFPKEIRKPLIEEMIVAYKFLAKIDKATPRVKKILHWGNHEHRFVKYLAEMKSELNPFHSDNILENIVNGFVHHDRLRKKKTKYAPLSENFVVTNSWYVKYNDLIVAHPINFSKINLRTATLTVEHFLKRGMNVRAVLIGHTHKWGITSHYNVLTGELGCTCHAMEYADKGNIGYSSQDYGYAIVSFKDKKVDVADTRLYKVLVNEGGDAEWLETEYADQN